MLRLGQHIVYVDEHGRKRDALVTNVGVPSDPKTWINLVIVSDDTAQTDSYGRKIERRTSVGAYHEGWIGNFWLLPKEDEAEG